MGIGELLDQIRAQYVAQFAAAMKELSRRSDTQMASEVALRNESGEAVGEGVLGLPMRVDLVAVSGTQATECLSVNSDCLLAFRPIRFAWSDRLTVILGPFSWDNLTIRIPAVDRDFDGRPLVGWFQDWFREDEDGAGGLLGVVHFLSDPENVGPEVRLTADLGSAPVEAFEGLLDTVAALGVSEVVIGDDGKAEQGAALDRGG